MPRGLDIPTARCAMIPVAANIDVAVIRIPAEGTGSVRCSSTPAARVARRSTRRRDGSCPEGQPDQRAFDLVGVDPRGVGHRPRNCAAAPMPSSTPGAPTPWSTTVRPASRTSRRCTSSSPIGASAGWARTSCPASEPRPRPDDMDTVRRGPRRRADQLSGLLLRNPDRHVLRQPARRPRPRNGASMVRSTRASARSRRASARWPPSSRRSTTTPLTARCRRTAPTGPGPTNRSPGSRRWSTRWWPARPR